MKASWNSIELKNSFMILTQYGSLLSCFVGWIVVAFTTSSTTIGLTNIFPYLVIRISQKIFLKRKYKKI